MSPDELKAAATKAHTFMQTKAPRIVGIEGKKHFQGSFEREKQGFTDEKLVRWQDIKESTKKQKRRSHGGKLPPILTDKGHLRDSIVFEAHPGEVIFSSNLPQAEVHNEGGGPKNMPQRQFMGPSKELEKKIVDKIESELDKIFGF